MTVERKVALITGITGQDGSYLAEFLLAKGYTVRRKKIDANHRFGMPQKTNLSLFVFTRFMELSVVPLASTLAVSTTSTAIATRLE